MFILVFFFFSSRRRHTRWNCDWSSDVCSSDLSDTHQRRRRYARQRLAAAGASSGDDRAMNQATLIPAFVKRSSFIELTGRSRAQSLFDEGTAWRELVGPFDRIESPW